MIKRNALLRKAINKLYDSVFAPVAPTCNALAKELKNVCNIAYLLYQKIKKELEIWTYIERHRRKKAREEEGKTGEQEEEQAEEGVDLAPQDHKRALERSYKIFVIHVSSKVGIKNYVDQAKPHIKVLIDKKES